MCKYYSLLFDDKCQYNKSPALPFTLLALRITDTDRAYTTNITNNKPKTTTMDTSQYKDMSIMELLEVMKSQEPPHTQPFSLNDVFKAFGDSPFIGAKAHD